MRDKNTRLRNPIVSYYIYEQKQSHLKFVSPHFNSTLTHADIKNFYSRCSDDNFDSKKKVSHQNRSL